MSSSPARSHMTIGEVLGLLSADFPDVTISKIRFLEAEGLIEPERTPSGYRKFERGDVERLRFILTAQRDHYVPLRVIKEHLDAADRGLDPPPLGARRQAPRGLVATDSVRDDSPAVSLTRRQLADAAGIDDEALTELEEFGLVHRVGGRYDREALTIARTAGARRPFGFAARHPRAVEAAAGPGSGPIEAAGAPPPRPRSPRARPRAPRAAGESA